MLHDPKNIPPDHDPKKKLMSKGFQESSITDFPIRSKRAILIFRRRRWKVEGEKKLLMREIPLSFPGTQLGRELALFLKGRG